MEKPYRGSSDIFVKIVRKRKSKIISTRLIILILNNQIIILTKEGLGIRSTARVLKISITTLLKRIVAIAQSIPLPSVSTGKIYEVDEIRTFLKKKNKLVWTVYALDRESKKVVIFYVGSRTNKTLNRVLHILSLSDAKRIYTDGLANYHYLIDRKIHKVIPHGTNHIERKNLTLRTHLKRLNRRTIAFPKPGRFKCSIENIFLV